MADDVIQQKLNSLAKCIERLEAKKPRSPAILEQDIDLQDIISVNLERLVQVSVDIAMLLASKKNLQPFPSSMSQSFEVLAIHKIISAELSVRLQKAVGFRNLSVHEYDKINWKIVYTILEKHLIDFKNFGKIAETF